MKNLTGTESLNATQFVNNVRQAPDSTQKITATLEITSFDPASMETQIDTFLKNYISQSTAGTANPVPATDVFITSYVISDISVDTTFVPGAVTTIQHYVYNAVPGILQAKGLSLVNAHTGAIVAGAFAGAFMNTADGYVAAPTIVSGKVLNPFTDQWYSSIYAAGFYPGASIEGGIIDVHQVPFYGFTAAGEPIFGAGFNLFGALSSAASSVQSMFQQGATAVSNAIAPITAAAASNLQIMKSTNTAGTNTTNAVSQFVNSFGQAIGNAIPFLGGVSSNFSSGISGTISHALSAASSSLANVNAGAAGAIASGVSSFQNTVYHVGSTISNLPKSLQNASAKAVGYVYNTLGNTGADLAQVSSAVLSPMYTSVKNLPSVINGTLATIGATTRNVYTNIASAVTGSLSSATNALDTVGNSITSSVAGTIKSGLDSFGRIGADLSGIINGSLSSMAAIAGAPAHFFDWTGAVGGYVSQVIIYVVIGAAIVVGIVVLVVVLQRREGKKHGI